MRRCATHRATHYGGGKQASVYCSGAVPGIGPFQLLSCDGSKRDVATMVHESGHAVHNVRAYPKGHLQYRPPLTLVETASIFEEMIVFQDLLGMANQRSSDWPIDGKD